MGEGMKRAFAAARATRLPPKRNPILRKKVYERDKGICCVCGIYDAKWEADHRLELWEGGKDALDNMQTLCRRHHQDKTSAATPARAKTDRLRERHELTLSRRKVETI